MASYFVARHAPPGGIHAVHDRSLCPPACFPFHGATEYLGEFTEAAQAVAVARLRYAQAGGCICGATPALAAVSAMPPAAALTPLRH
jgi:hypothetical protein